MLFARIKTGPGYSDYREEERPYTREDINLAINWFNDIPLNTRLVTFGRDENVVAYWMASTRKEEGVIGYGSSEKECFYRIDRCQPA